MRQRRSSPTNIPTEPESPAPAQEKPQEVTKPEPSKAKKPRAVKAAPPAAQERLPDSIIPEEAIRAAVAKATPVLQAPPSALESPEKPKKAAPARPRASRKPAQETGPDLFSVKIESDSKPVALPSPVIATKPPTVVTQPIAEPASTPTPASQPVSREAAAPRVQPAESAPVSQPPPITQPTIVPQVIALAQPPPPAIVESAPPQPAARPEPHRESVPVSGQNSPTHDSAGSVVSPSPSVTSSVEQSVPSLPVVQPVNGGQAVQTGQAFQGGGQAPPAGRVVSLGISSQTVGSKVLTATTAIFAIKIIAGIVIIAAAESTLTETGRGWMVETLTRKMDL